MDSFNKVERIDLGIHFCSFFSTAITSASVTVVKVDIMIGYFCYPVQMLGRI